MKVVLFCGGYGMRMRDGVTDLPKPMTPVGDRPLLWHVMRYYAHYGHKDFILCLGFGAAHIKDYFLNYRETESNDFVLRDGGASVELLANDIEDWTITFVDTGLETAIGERLRRVRPHLGDDPMFLANYADVLTDAPLETMIEDFRRVPEALASLLAVPPQSAFHMVMVTVDRKVSEIRQVSDMPICENGGYFIFRSGIFDFLEPGEDLVGDTLTRLSADGRVHAFNHTGFWKPADTVKERTVLEQMYRSGDRPWAKWETEPGQDAAPR
jgi:glucose-1-phosphate cytidylyltransferase